MTVEKLSVALDQRVAAAARRAAARAGLSLSAWLSQAADRAARIDEGLLGVAEWEAAHGALSGAERAAADRALDTIQDRRRAGAS